MFQRSGVVAALMAAFVLTACGGGGPSVSAVKVAGDSLADSGTFGFKFTVQGNPIWTDLVADAVNAPTLCPRYVATSATNVVPNPQAAGCTSYAVGGALINPRGGVEADTSPFSVVQQLKTLAAEQRFKPDEMLLVDGGGNDVAGLVTAYLTAGGDGGASYGGLLGELLTPAEVGANLANPQAAGTLYMTRLADLLADTLEQHALQRGARRVVVVNVPDVTLTPRFLDTLQFIAAQGPTGPATAAAVKGLAGDWVKAFNDRIHARLGKKPQMVIVDFSRLLTEWTTNPSAYGLTNVTKPACPGLIQECTNEILDSLAPGDGRRGYVFSDNFHGTPKTNELVADAVLDAVMAKGPRGWK
jgi:phospholipase/lecithinase/hemolysin